MMTHVFKKSLVMAAMVAAFAVAQANTSMAQGVGEANAVLDLSTGEITLNLGSNLQVLGLTGTTFDTSGFNTDSGLGPAGQLDSGNIGFVGFVPFGAGTFNLGAVLDASIRNEAGVAGFEFSFGQAGVPSQTATIGSGVTVVGGGGGTPAVPEPSSLSLLALAGLGAVARRRR